MKKKLIIILLVFTSAIFLIGENSIAVLSEVEKPNQLILSEDNVYVTDQYKIHIYNRQNFKFKKSFGKKGEGPEEFPSMVKLYCYDNELIVITISKILWFSKDGNYIKEVKKQSSGIIVIPILNGYLKFIMGFNKKENYVTEKIGVFDKKMNIKKVLFEREKKRFRPSSKEFSAFENNIIPVTDKNNILLADRRENYAIKVFNHNGMLIKNIIKSYPKIIITQNYKKSFIENIINDQFNNRLKSYFRNLKYKFPKYYPPFDKLFSEEKTIYAFRDIPDFSQYEIWAMTKNGEIKKKIKVKKATCYWIENGIYYYILENEEDDEEWELYSKKIL